MIYEKWCVYIKFSLYTSNNIAIKFFFRKIRFKNKELIALPFLTNAHVADCDYTFYENSVCCINQEIYGQVECSEETEPCLAPGISNCCQPEGTNPISDFPQYCSYGVDDLQQQGEQGYCCYTGFYWNPGTMGCESAYPCYDPEYPSNPILCNYLISAPEFYFNDPECIYEGEPYWLACCYDQFKYETEYYGYCEVEAVE